MINNIVIAVILLILDVQENESCQIAPRTTEDECTVAVECYESMEIEVPMLMKEQSKCPRFEEHYSRKHGYWRELDIDVMLDIHDIGEYVLSMPLPDSDDITFRKHVKSLKAYSNNWQFVPWLQLATSYEYLTSLNLSGNHIETFDTSDVAKYMNKLLILDLSHNKINYVNKTEYSLQNLKDTVDYEDVEEKVPLSSILKTLILSNNQLETLGHKAFFHFASLKKLDVSYNKLNTLNMDFDGLFKLTDLNLSHNNISSLESSLTRFTSLLSLNVGFNNLSVITKEYFRYVDTLRVLNLTHNRIESIESSVFDQMTLLQKVDLSGNLLTGDICSLFLLNVNLKVVNIRDNTMSVLPKNTFSNHNISFIDISGNQLSGEIEMETFDGFYNMEELDLSGQNLTELSSWAFKGVSLLTKLDLSSKFIYTINGSCFKGLTKLNNLDLSNNRLTDINFDKSDLIALTHLSLESNNITTVKNADFKKLSLVQLDLSSNHIFEIGNNTFGQVIFLKLAHNKIANLSLNAFIDASGLGFLDLSYNDLNKFDVNTSTISDLSSLYLNNNNLVRITDSYFINCTKLFVLGMFNNQIEDIEDNSFRTLKQLTFLNLANNSLSNLKKDTFLNLKNLHHIDISGNRLKDSLNVINSYMENVDLGKNQISEMSFPVHNNLRSVDISNNHISFIKSTCFIYLKELGSVDVSNNVIWEISPGSFINQVNVVRLNISHNLLTTIGFGTFTRIVVLNEHVFYSIKQLEFLIVDHNKIHSINMTSLLNIVNISRISIGGNHLDCNWLTEVQRLVEHEVLVVSIEALTLSHHTHNVGGISCIPGKESSAMVENVHPYPSESNGLSLSLASIMKSGMDTFNNNSENQQRIQQSVVNELHNLNKNEKISIDVLRNYSANIYKYLATDSNKKYTNLNTALSALLKEQNDITLTAFKSVIKSMNDMKTVGSVDMPNNTKDHLNIDFQITPKLNNTIYDVYSKINETKMELSEEIKSLRKELRDNRRGKETGPPYSTISGARMATTLGGVDRAASSTLTESCVVIILVILCLFIIYNVYTSKNWRRLSTSQSTHHISNEIEM